MKAWFVSIGVGMVVTVVLDLLWNPPDLSEATNMTEYLQIQQQQETQLLIVGVVFLLVSTAVYWWMSRELRREAEYGRKTRRLASGQQRERS